MVDHIINYEVDWKRIAAEKLLQGNYDRFFGFALVQLYAETCVREAMAVTKMQTNHGSTDYFTSTFFAAVASFITNHYDGLSAARSTDETCGIVITKEDLEYFE